MADLLQDIAVEEEPITATLWALEQTLHRADRSIVETVQSRVGCFCREALMVMNLLSAIAEVLSRVGKPLHYQEITQRILDRGLWKTESKTPDVVVKARLAADINRRGYKSRFQRTAEGMFALRSWGLPEFTPEARAARPVKKAKITDKPGRKEKENGQEKAKGKVKKATAPAASLSFTDAAEQVLERFGGAKPMHYRAITAKALELKLLRSEGPAPHATLYTQILTEIARGGGAVRFVNHGKGLVGLARWLPKGTAALIDQQNATVCKKLLACLRALPPAEFEALIGELLVRIGFDDLVVTARSDDGSLDLRGVLVVGGVIHSRMAVQAKKWKPNVQAPVVQQVRGSLGAHEQGLIITPGDFSAEARAEAERTDVAPVALMNGEQLTALLIEHEIGVSRQTYEVIELEEGARE